MDGHDKYRQKLRALVEEQYSAWLMNNTKWREVFEVLADRECVFAVDWIYGQSYDAFGTVVDSLRWVNQPIERALVDQAGLRDPGIGGPFDYLCIYSLSVPGKVPSHVACRHDLRIQNIDLLESRMAELGQLPVVVEQELWKLTAYVPKVAI